MVLTGYIPTERSLNTRCHATIYRFDADPIVLVGDPTTHRGAGGPAALISSSIQKSIASPAGSWTLGLKQGSLDIRKEIKSGDWVVIHWTENGVPIHGTLGMIRNVTRARRSQNGNTIEDWTITGADFGRIFELTQIWFDDLTNYETNAGGAIMGARFGWLPIGTPDGIVLNIINAWLGFDSESQLGGTWEWPRGLEHLGSRFTEGLHSVIADHAPFSLASFRRATIPTEMVDVAGTIFNTSVANLVEARQQAERIGAFRASFHNLRGIIGDELNLFQPNMGAVLQSFLSEYSNPMLNELFYDIMDGADGSTPLKPKPAVFHRERPFVNATEGMNSPWFKLPTVRLRRDDILTDTLTFNDDERLNTFLVYAAGLGISNVEQIALNGPVYDKASCARYGMRKFERQTRFISPTEGKTWQDEINEWLRLLTSWHGLNHEWLSGPITVPFIPKGARIGRRLVVGEDADVEREQSYIEGTSINWRYPTGAQTTMNVTHGYRGSDHKLVAAVTAEANKYTSDSNARTKPSDVSTAVGSRILEAID